MFTTRNLVFRLDLIPETEQLHILKIGMFGIPRSCIVDLKNFEKIDFRKEDSYSYRWYKTITWVPKEDRNMVFRNISTGECFTFSHRGLWNQEGLNHELLN